MNPLFAKFVEIGRVVLRHLEEDTHEKKYYDDDDDNNNNNDDDNRQISIKNSSIQVN